MVAVPNIKLNSGYDMPQVGFGLWKVGNDVASDVVYNAIKAGYRLFDGACGTWLMRLLFSLRTTFGFVESWTPGQASRRVPRPLSNEECSSFATGDPPAFSHGGAEGRSRDDAFSQLPRPLFFPLSPLISPPPPLSPGQGGTAWDSAEPLPAPPASTPPPSPALRDGGKYRVA
jgi:hypothetical protein